MTPRARVGIGFLVGALLVLLLHPISRPHFALTIWQSGPSLVASQSPLFRANLKQVPPPRTDVEAAYYLLLACEQYLSLGDSIRPEEALFAYQTALSQADRESDNAFWATMAAVFAPDVARKREALRRAASATRYDDRQSARLQQMLDALRAEYGGTMMWQPLVASLDRSEAPARALRRATRRVLRDPALSVQTQFDLILIGNLLREGGRSVRVAMHGVRLMEEATAPQFIDQAPSRSAVLRSRAVFTERLSSLDLSSVERSNMLFLQADSWENVMTRRAMQENMARNGWLALMVSSLPSALLHGWAVSLLICILGLAFSRWSGTGRLLEVPWPPLAGLFLGLIAFQFTRLLWPSLWIVLFIAFFLFKPDRVRSRDPKELRPAHRLVIALGGVAFLGFWTAFALGLSPAAHALYPMLAVPTEYRSGSSLLLGLALLMMSLLLFTIPCYGWINRERLASLLPLTLQELSYRLFAISSCLIVLITPICLVIELRYTDRMVRFMQNEPTLYMSE